MVSVPDVDQHYARAVAAGARIVRPPETHPFGERQYTAADLGGHQWTFSQSVADIDPAAWGGQLTEPESQPMELCDLVDEQGAPTSQTVPRGTPLAPGEYYQVVHVWIRNEAGEYLVQQRAHDLDTDPDVWAVTAGYVQAGEDRMSAAVRETREELGLALQPDQLRRLRQQALENRFEDVWLATVTRAALGPPQPGPEVADWKWASKAALSELIGRGEFFRYSYFGSLPD
jgi:8-oxo-dGTP pyrophosphatase MutT (NUDIX family)